MNGDDNGGNDPCEETHKYMTIKYYCECQDVKSMEKYVFTTRRYPCMIG